MMETEQGEIEPFHCSEISFRSVVTVSADRTPLLWRWRRRASPPADKRSLASERQSEEPISVGEGGAARPVAVGGKDWSGGVPFLSQRAKMEASLSRLLLPLLVVLTGTSSVMGWEQPEKVLLRDVQALTLYRGKYTNYRRTSPVPQLQCTGGSAGCTAYTPEVVQCYNKGWDGSDVQWECKAHLDVSYRFGKIEVSCEGYDYPADPFILKGSCGLEYTLELTKEGQQKANTFSGTYYSATSHDSFGSGFGVILVILFVVFVFGIYKLFLCDNRQHNFPNDDVHSGSYGQSYQSPPPPGFKSNYTGAASGSSYDSNSGPGFWTGLGAGGLLGYLIGNRRSPSDHRYSPYYSTWAGPSAPPPFTGSFGNSNSCSTSYSSETKPTSGFGGTKRR